MTNKLSSFAAGLLGACAIIGCAVAGPLAAGSASGDQTGSIPNPVLRNVSSERIYCYIGATGERANLRRGWVCQQDSVPESS
ncbi:MAG: hypothetical protein ACLPSF_10175 [Methylocella sp.]